MANLAKASEGTIDKVMGVIVILAILGGTIGLIFTNMDSVVNAFSSYTNVNDPTLAALVPVFGLVIGIGIVLGVVKLVKRGTS